MNAFSHLLLFLEIGSLLREYGPDDAEVIALDISDHDRCKAAVRRWSEETRRLLPRFKAIVDQLYAEGFISEEAYARRMLPTITMADGRSFYVGSDGVKAPLTIKGYVASWDDVFSRASASLSKKIHFYEIDSARSLAHAKVALQVDIGAPLR